MEDDRYDFVILIVERYYWESFDRNLTQIGLIRNNDIRDSNSRKTEF